MQTHTIDTRWVKIHSVEKILVFSIFHITSHFLCVTLRLADPCGPSGSLRSDNPTTSSRAHLASALKSTAVFRFNDIAGFRRLRDVAKSAKEDERLKSGIGQENRKSVSFLIFQPRENV